MKPSRSCCSCQGDFEEGDEIFTGYEGLSRCKHCHDRHLGRWVPFGHDKVILPNRRIFHELPGWRRFFRAFFS